MTVSFFGGVISNAGTLFTSFYICGRAMNHKVTTVQGMLSVLWCLLWAALYALEPVCMSLFIIRIASCASTIVFIGGMLETTLDTVVSAYLLSFGSSYVFFIMSTVINSVFFAPTLSVDIALESLVDFNQPIYLLFYSLTALLQFFIAYRFFKMRRFKLGFPFLSGRYTVAVSLIIAGGFLAVSSFIVGSRESYGTYYIVLPIIAGIVLVGVGIYIWVRRRMKMHQRRRAWERNEEIYRQEMERLAGELRHYKEMHETVRAANHKMMHRQSAVERYLLKTIELVREAGLPAEFSEELSVLLDEISSLSKEYQEMVGSGRVARKLPSTNIPSTDGLFGLFAERFSKSDIDFNLKVNGSIVHMVETVIPKNKLETMMGDHLQDALMAVDAGDGAVRSVLAVIGEAEGCYAFSIQDSGVPFAADTLVRLGTEHITSHANQGGSGKGFMTTFETMRECGASLIIHENPSGSSFSKIVTIRFDGQGQYIIETHRSGDFPPSDRYTVVGYT